MLFEKLNNLLKEAIRSNSEFVKNYTRSIKSRITEYQIANRLDKDQVPENEIVLKVVKSYVKQLNKAIVLLSKGKSSDKLIQEYKAEIKFFEDLCIERLTK
jgi:uncharacterized protein YqeY